ncbi:Gfo/Idh/MocA family oxidoreductase [Paenibacillus sp. CC-CFT747]|nr:Gfo/Idh/MocA family oxidoreductase [Paenibacillus sp. CC-CFT747]
MKTVRFAFVGLGNIAKTHIVALKAMPVIKKLPFQPVLDTLVTRNLSANENQARAMGFTHVTDSLSEALKDRELEVVDICTPNAMHLEAVRHAAAADKILYCEKPLTDTYENSAELVRTAGDRHPHQVALVYRYHPAVMRLKEAVRLGLIGEVLQIKLSYRRSGYLDAKRPVSWRLKDDLSGGGPFPILGCTCWILSATCSGRSRKLREDECFRQGAARDPRIGREGPYPCG